MMSILERGRLVVTWDRGWRKGGGGGVLGLEGLRGDEDGGEKGHFRSEEGLREDWWHLALGSK